MKKISYSGYPFQPFNGDKPAGRPHASGGGPRETFGILTECRGQRCATTSSASGLGFFLSYDKDCQIKC
jgi:hypothetical protein